MRWLLAAVGALTLLATSYLALRPRLTRPVLRVGIDQGRVEDEAVTAGVALALDERDERGGRFRVEAVPHPKDASKIHFKMWMPGLSDVPNGWLDEGGQSLVVAELGGQAERILDWAKARGLRRVALPTTFRPPPGKVEDNSNSSYAALGLRPSLGDALEKRMPAPDLLWVRDPDLKRLVRLTIEARADLVVLEDAPGLVDLVDDLRAAGYAGPLFLSRFNPADLKGLDGCLTVLAPLKPPPPGFRHPSPFAYAGYLGTLRFLDALDAVPAAEPEDHCLPSVFDDLRGEPRVFEVRGGRFFAR